MSRSFARNVIPVAIALKLAFAGFASATPDERPDFNDPAERKAVMTLAQGISEGVASETSPASNGNKKPKTITTKLKLRSKFNPANQNTSWGLEENETDAPETTLDNEPACPSCLSEICACAKQDNAPKFG